LVRYTTTPGGAPIGNLTSGGVYAVAKLSSFQVKLASAAATFNAADSNVVILNGSAVNVAGSTFIDGDKVVYYAAGGTPIGGLEDGHVSYVRKVGDAVTFYDNEAAATSVSPPAPRQLTALGTGQHQLFRLSQTIALNPSKTAADARVVHTLARVS